MFKREKEAHLGQSVNPVLIWFHQMGWGGSLAAESSYSSQDFGVQGSLTFQLPTSSMLCPDFLQASWDTEVAERERQTGSLSYCIKGDTQSSE